MAQVRFLRNSLNHETAKGVKFTKDQIVPDMPQGSAERWLRRGAVEILVADDPRVPAPTKTVTPAAGVQTPKADGAPSTTKPADDGAGAKPNGDGQAPAGGDTAIEIPADWQSMQWGPMRALALKLDPKAGANKESVQAAIEAELAKRAEAAKAAELAKANA